MTTGVFEVFGAVFLTTAIYLLIIWRLILRWNASHLGPALTFANTPAVLRVVWGRAPEKHDAAFLRLRAAARIAFVLAGAGILSWFGFVALVASH
jgi:hypothetical protein